MAISKHFLFFGVLAILFCGLGILSEKATERFALMRIQCQLPGDPALDCSHMPIEQEEEITRVLSQPFHYLSRGGQCFAFVSDDGKYVIKFFRQRSSKYKGEKKKAMYQMYFESAALAYRELREESSLIWVHLSRTPTQPRVLKIYDKLHIAHNVYLENTIFVLQKKGILPVDYFSALVKNHALEQAKQGLIDMASLIAQRCNKGIDDIDAALHKNMGFFDGQPMFIDIGNFRKASQQKNQIHSEDATKPINEFYLWMEKTHPELLAALVGEPASI